MSYPYSISSVNKHHFSEEMDKGSKRKQTLHSEYKKTRVVYEIIVEHQSKASTTRKYGIAESTIRGWVKTATAYLELAKQQGRSVDLEPEGFFENGRLCTDVWKTITSSPTTSKPSSSSITSSAISNRSYPIFDPVESTWRLSRVDNSDAASSSTSSSPSPSDSMMDTDCRADNNPASLEMRSTAVSGTGQFMDEAVILAYLHERSLRTCEFKFRHFMDNSDEQNSKIINYGMDELTELFEYVRAMKNQQIGQSSML